MFTESGNILKYKKILGLEDVACSASDRSLKSYMNERFDDFSACNKFITSLLFVMLEVTLNLCANLCIPVKDKQLQLFFTLVDLLVNQRFRFHRSFRFLAV